MIDFYVGGYARPEQAGIKRFHLDPETLEYRQVAEFSGLANPSWLLKHPEKPVLYAVEELTPEGRVLALAIRPDGGLERLGESLPSGGADPCHLSLSPDGRWLFAANYTSGSLSVFALGADGAIAGRSDFRQHAIEAPGAIPTRQERAHVHFTLCDGGRVFVCDLGSNTVFVYGWDNERGRLVDTDARLPFPPASGPRHLALSADGKRLYVLCELTSAVHVFGQDACGAWQPVQAVPAIPDFDAFETFNWSVGAAIHFADARTLYVSNRGHQSLVRFDVGADGRLSGRRTIPSGGKTPRDFLPVGGLLLAANQDSDALAVLRADGDGAPVARIPAIKPTCVCLIGA